MADIKTKTIFSRIPSVLTRNGEGNRENRKISDWLEKLHTQGEKVRIDNNRREKEAKKTLNNRSEQEQSKRIAHKSPSQLGIDAQARTAAKKIESDRQLVNDLVKKSNRSIIRISSSFPWNFFPNSVDVEEGRVTFKFSQFLSSQSHSVEIKDISNVFIESSLFFATLQVVSRTYIQNDIKIRHLNKRKAMQVQRIIEGLRTFVEHNINTSNYEINELISKIEEFHTTS